MKRQMSQELQCWAIEQKTDIGYALIDNQYHGANGRLVGTIPELYPNRKMAKDSCEAKERPVRVKVTVEVMA